MTRIKTRDYDATNRCPFCNSYDVSTADDYADDHAYVLVSICNGCGAIAHERYAYDETTWSDE